MAVIEAQVEERLCNDGNAKAEDIVRERVVYIDARNAMFCLLWILVVRNWKGPMTKWENVEMTQNEERAEYVNLLEEDIEVYYVIATFLSRCRYCHRYGFESEMQFYTEVRQLCSKVGEDKVYNEFERLSEDLYKCRKFSLLEWTAQEYQLEWNPGQFKRNSAMVCKWNDDSGQRQEAVCDIMLRTET